MVFCNTVDNYEDYYNYNSHNPYFNRWFSAMEETMYNSIEDAEVTILILIDGFLQ